jgi:long-subunit fatty acid transport protein
MTETNRLLITALACFLAFNAKAQIVAPAGDLSVFPLNPLPVSARCLGMASACTAIANDVDMLTENPAGVAGIENTGINIQARYASLETVYLDQDAVNSAYQGWREGQLYKPLKDEPVDISFAGISKPFGRWTVSAFYQKTLGFDGSVDVEEVRDTDNAHLFTNRNGLSTSLDIFGVSAAFKISDDWSVGLSVMGAELEIESEDSWQLDSLSGDPLLQSDFDTVLLGNRIRDDASDTLLQFGLIYQPGGKFSAGLNYRQGGEFDLDSRSVQLFGRDGSLQDNSTPAGTSVSLPDTLSVGVGWRPGDSLLLSFDIARLGHSDLPPVRDHTLGLNLSVEELTESIDDTTSFRLGFEKQFSGGGQASNQYALRIGILTEDDHDGLVIVEGYDTQFTAGFGALFGRQNQFGLDTGVQFGDEEILFLASFSYGLK